MTTPLEAELVSQLDAAGASYLAVRKAITYGTPVAWLPPAPVFELAGLKIEVADPSPESTICYTATIPTKWAR